MKKQIVLFSYVMCLVFGLIAVGRCDSGIQAAYNWTHSPAFNSGCRPPDNWWYPYSWTGANNNRVNVSLVCTVCTQGRDSCHKIYKHFSDISVSEMSKIRLCGKEILIGNCPKKTKKGNA